VTPNSCAITVGQITNRIRSAGAGLEAQKVTLTLTSAAGNIVCRLDNCVTRTDIWPPAGANALGRNIQISGVYTFESMISMFWPGAGSPTSFAAVNLPAASREQIQF